MLSLNSTSIRFTEEQVSAAEAEIIWNVTKVAMPNIAAVELVAYAAGEIQDFQAVSKISNMLINHMVDNGFDLETAEDTVMSLRIDTKRERAELRNKALAKLRK